MGEEIERKFLVTGNGWQKGDSEIYRQGYLSLDKHRTVRIRSAGDTARITVKGITEDATRSEFEYSIPVDDADRMLESLCLRPLIEKRRYRVDYHGMTWEIDRFYGANEGLVVAEIELEDPRQEFEKPDWIGDEVTSDPRFYNTSLVDHPYCEWSDRPADRTDRDTASDGHR